MNVREIASREGRSYITPEDVTEAIQTGCSQTDVWMHVLEAVDAKAAEDQSLCAFIALTKFGFRSGRERT